MPSMLNVEVLDARVVPATWTYVSGTFQGQVSGPPRMVDYGKPVNIAPALAFGGNLVDAEVNKEGEDTILDFP